jgi:calreticulin
LVVKPDNTFDVLIDMKSVESGSLEENFDFLLPKEIKDPKESKPVDWVDAKKIADPEDKKPAGYDDIPAEIPDSDAVKPDDWDTEEDGEYEAPMIPNPEFKGPWKPKMIDNPAYKGEWVHPLIPNPDYKEDKELYLRANEVKHIGFELWQVASGTVFDDILVTDSLDEAKAYAEETFFKKKDAEKKMFDEYEAAVKAQQKENEAKNPPADVDEDDEDDEDDRDEL